MHWIEDLMALMMKLILGDHMFNLEPSPPRLNHKKLRYSEDETKGDHQLGCGLNDDKDQEGQTRLNKDQGQPKLMYKTW
jgi:hypothetical protein